MVILKKFQFFFQIQLSYIQAYLPHLFLNKYLIPFLIITPSPYTHFNSFIITTLLFFLAHQHGYEKAN
jgi:hypothetical protein